MGIAFSGAHAPEQIYYGTFTGTDRDSYIAEWDTRFRSVGWIATPITGGFRYTITSPEGLTALVEMWHTDNTGQVWFRMLSSGATSRVSTSYFVYPIGTAIDSTPQTMVLWCNPCQWFIAKVGTSGSGEFWPRSVMGGIPKTDACDGGLAGESWWFLGDDNFNGTFRRTCEPSTSFSVCTNGVLRASPSAAYEADRLRIVRRVWTAWNHWDRSDAYHANDPVVFADGTGILYDPLIAWSVTDGKVAPIQGELWDSFMDTKEAALEATRSTTEPMAGGGTGTRQWASFMHGPKSDGSRTNASFWLLLPETGITPHWIMNIAY